MFGMTFRYIQVAEQANKLYKVNQPKDQNKLYYKPKENKQTAPQGVDFILLALRSTKYEDAGGG